MKIISWNINGIRSVYTKGFLDWLIKTDPDILCLQEIKAREIPQNSDLFSSDPTSIYNIFINSAVKKGYSGVAVLSKQKPLKEVKTLNFERFDGEGRILELEFINFTLINLYIPHGARDKHNLDYKLTVYIKLLDKLKKYKNQKVIITGDFNIAHEDIDLARPNENRNNIMFTFNERQQIEKLLDLGFIDSFRIFHKGTGNYSWWPYHSGLRDKNIGWRIDYEFVSQNLGKFITGAFILKDVYGSDHCPIGIDIAL